MKALNRKEVLVNAKANGTLDSFKPLTRDEAFTKKALGLGGGASSWNDLTDKPFGEEVGEVVLSPEAIYTVESIMGTRGISPVNPTAIKTFEEGRIYTVNWNDKTYQVEASDIDGELGLNISEENVMIGVGLDQRGNFTVICPDLDRGSECKIKLSTMGEIIKTLDPKYLPGGGSGGGAVYVDIAYSEDDWDDISHSYMHCSANKTFAEILDAYLNGATVICRVPFVDETETYLDLIPLSGLTHSNDYSDTYGQAKFKLATFDGYDIYGREVFIEADGLVEYAVYTKEL